MPEEDGSRRVFNKKTSIGLCIVLGIAVSWVGSSQLSQTTQKDYDSINSPMFMTWFSTIFNVALAVPGVLWRRSVLQEVSKEDAAKIFGFYILWVGANYCFTRALLLASAGVVTSFMGTTPAWVALGSILILPQSPTTSHRGTYLAVVITVSGSILVAQPWGGGDASLGGVLLSTSAALMAASYKVLFKHVFGSPSSALVGVYLGLIGLYAATFGTVVLWVLLLSGAESVTWSGVPWGILTLTSLLSLAFNYLINYGISFTYPLFISLGTVLGIPLNTVADYYFHSTVPSTSMFIGISLICLGFLMFVAVDIHHKTTFPTTIDDVRSSDDDDDTDSEEAVVNHLPGETDPLLPTHAARS